MNTEILDDNLKRKKSKQDLNTANGILTMGIVSTVLSLILGGLFGLAPLVLGILAIVKGKQAISLFNEYPNDYTRSSFNKARAGFILGIIGVSFWGLMRLLLISLMAA